MKGYLKPIFALAATALLATGNVQADTEEKMIIALKTDDFEMTNTDISSLAIGESQTIETDSGQVIDLLRTADGVEIYVDGELLEMGFELKSSATTMKNATRTFLCLPVMIPILPVL